MSETKPNYAVPAAIIIAGVLIASALYFGDSGTPRTGKTVRLDQVISQLKINQTAFSACIKDPVIAKKVTEDEENALAMGAEGTPFNVIISQTGKKVAIPGAYPEQELKQIIASLEQSTTTDQSLEIIRPVSATDHVLGRADAKITVIEYSDLRCPFCARFQTTMNSIIKTTPDVRWVYRHYPLDGLHPDARTLAIASECVASLGDNDKFWQFADLVFELDKKLVTN